MDRCNILGVGVHPSSYDEIIANVEHEIAINQSGYYCFTPVHSLVMAYKNAEYNIVLNKSTRTVPDGMPVVWVLKLLRQKINTRVYGPDLMLKLCEYSQNKGYRHFFYGGTTEISNSLTKNLKSKFPSLIIAGTYVPPFRELTSEETENVRTKIMDSKADIIWVGLGAPKQDFFSEEFVKKTGKLFFGVGAAFEIHAGLKSQAPLWMQNNGLEWLYRFCQEPRRLWRRYLINNFKFIFLILLQFLHLKKFPLKGNNVI